MANPDLLIPHILKWEGGFVNDPLDRGGATNKGVTIATFRQYYGREASVSALKNITHSQWRHIFIDGYWNPWRADEIKSQSIANIVVDWAWHSGTKNSIKRVQHLCGLKDDGIVGPMTMQALNAADPGDLFNKIHLARMNYFSSLVKNNPSQQKFLRGWQNRVNDIKFNG